MACNISEGLYNNVVPEDSTLPPLKQDSTHEVEDFRKNMAHAQSASSAVSKKQLHRFYEPLVLLFALGTARGDRPRNLLPPSEQVDSLTNLQLRREFLNELAFLCNYRKGGDTVTAIGLEQTPQGYVYWVAANKSPENSIAPFLEELLSTLKKAIWKGTSESRNDQDVFEKIFRMSVTFARKRIQAYAEIFSSKLKRLKETSAFKQAAISEFIIEWENKVVDVAKEDPHSLVRFAHANRHSEFMHQLANRARERNYETGVDGLQEICRSTRHQMGRLGLHARSASVLARYTPRMMAYLDSYSVQAVPSLAEGIGRPLPRKKTTVEEALDRMLPADSLDLEGYKKALAQMDKPFQISERFLKHYSDSKTTVHAEIQVLHHFDDHNYEFAAGDKYIACSKPACFCCHLYFRHHPGRFVEPRSHHKIYLSWQPPGASGGAGKGRKNQLRDVLNLMTKDIRDDALDQIRRRMAPRIFHPDSVTGITYSAFTALDPNASSTIGEGDQEMDEHVNFSNDYSSFESDNAAGSSSETIQVDEYSDTDGEEGGVSLLGTMEASFGCMTAIEALRYLVVE